MIRAIRVLLATDAAGEGVNLQNANLMVNYDLPWNPNRIEQRFGRIHRIGQTEVCHLWNMVADETREGDVFQRLFEKLEVERKALGGRVFDILGEVFEDKSLKDLLIEAIRYGEDPERRASLLRKVEGALDTEHIESIIRPQRPVRRGNGREAPVRREGGDGEGRSPQAAALLHPLLLHAGVPELGGELRSREQGGTKSLTFPPSFANGIANSRGVIAATLTRSCAVTSAFVSRNSMSA